MNAYEKAIEYFKEEVNEFKGNNKTVRLAAIDALEKQIPKKAIKKEYSENNGEDYYDYGYDFSCPCCDNSVGTWSNEFEDWAYENLTYCNNCGQKLDWSDETND
jgi:hypothetical protein